MARKIQGTWKIAYADFITALMVLFLMLWLVGAVPESDLQGISEYFGENAPSQKVDFVKAMVKQKILDQEQDIFSAKGGLSSNEKEKLSSVLQSVKDSEIPKEFADNFCVYWHNGVVVDLFDTYNRSLFVSSTANLQPWAVNLINSFGKQILKNQKDYVVVEGHACSSARSADCWNLSFCRANIVRRYLEKYARNDQIIKVTGNGDRDPIDKEHPLAPINMRISIIFVDKNYVNKRQRSMPN
jgi:chemotaxis protein MotB